MIYARESPVITRGLSEAEEKQEGSPLRSE